MTPKDAARQQKRLFILFVIIGALALGFLLGVAPAIGAAPGSQAQPRIVVVTFPDLVGVDNGGLPCPGCDGEFGDADQLRAVSDPFPVLNVTLRDASGAPLGSNPTVPLPDGRLVTSFSVTARGEYSVELSAPSGDWVVCPGSALIVQVTGADFDEQARANVDVGFWHGCAGPAATGTSDLPTVEPTEPATTPTPEPALTPTLRPTDQGVRPDPTPAERPAPVDRRPSALGYIRGLVFQDLDADGALGVDEPGLSDVAVRLQGGGLDLVQLTGTTGTFSFAGLGAGEYEVFIEPGSEWRVTTKDRYAAVRVSGDDVQGIDFGLLRVGAAPAEDADASVIAPRLPSTGLPEFARGRLLLGFTGLAALIGLLGLALEAGLVRRTGSTSKGQQ